MTSEKLQQLIKEWESAKVDFKRQWYWNDNMSNNIKEVHKNELVKDLIALTNGDIYSINKMAYLIIGIDNKREHYDFDKSIILPLDKLKQQLFTLLNNYAQPEFLALDIEFIDEVLVISVPPRGSLISLSKDLKLKNNTDKKGTTYYRVGEDIRVASSEVIKEFEKTFKKNEQNIIVYKDKISSKLTLLPISKEKILGREKELTYIKNFLENSNKPLLIHGIGGIGKTTLLRYFFNQQKDKFDYCAYFSNGSDIESQIVDELSMAFNIEEKEYDRKLKAIFLKLQNLKGKKLLCIDDIQNIKKQEKIIEILLSLSQSNNFKIIFTSRISQIKNMQSYHLGKLSKKEGRELFLQFYKTDEFQKIDKILNYIDYHTFFIEIIAKTIESEGYKLSEIIKKFINGELSSIDFIDEDDGYEISFNQILQDLFNMQNLDEKYILLLKKMLIFPASNKIYLFIIEFIFEKKRLKSQLNFLVRRGWLLYDKDGYSIHPLIREYILVNHLPSFQDIDKILEFMNFNVSIIADIKLLRFILPTFESFYLLLRKIAPKTNENFLIYCSNLSHIYLLFDNYKKANSLNKEVSISNVDNILVYFILTFNKGMIYFANGEGEKAQKFLKMANDVDEKVLLLEDESLIGLKDFIQGIIYLIENEEQEAKKFLSKAEQIIIDDKFKIMIEAMLLPLRKKESKKIDALKEKIFEDIRIIEKSKNHPIANILGCFELGRQYLDKQKYNKTEALLNKAIELSIYFFEEEHSWTARSYTELADLYKTKKEYSKAEELYKKALKIREMIFEETHYEILHNYNDLALIYINMKKYIQAEELYIKILKIIEKSLGEEHKDIAEIYNNLGILYYKMKEYDKSKSAFIKALNIKEKVLGKNHKNIILAYNNLASVYQKKKEYEKSMSIFEKVLKIRMDLFNKDDIEISKSYSNISMLYFEMKNYKKAYDYRKRAIAIQEKKLLETDNILIRSKERLKEIMCKMELKDITSIKNFISKYKLKKYRVDDINIENAEVIFVLESPHKDEIEKGYPVAGKTGKNMSSILFDKNHNALGKLIYDELIKKKNGKKYDNSILKFGIINISSIPLQKKIYQDNEIFCLKNLFWLRENITRDKNAINRNFKKDKKEKNQLIQLLIDSLKLRILSINRKIILCGNFSQAFYKKAFGDIKYRETLKLLHPINWKNENNNNIKNKIFKFID